MKSTARIVGIVMIIMVFSRLMALMSNQVYITFFGIGLDMDIYSYAIQLPNIIFNSFGTALVTVVIPIFAGYMGTGEKERAFKFADNITSLAFIFTIGLSLLGILAAPLFVLMTRFRSEGYGFAVEALRIMFPIIMFYALNYVLQGILQSMGRFNMPAFVSVPSSLVIIVYVLTLGKKFGIKGLIIATFIGLALQALVLIPPIFKTEYRFHPSFDYKSEDIKNALRLIPPVLIGTSAYQVNMLFNITVSANFKDTVAIVTFVQNLILYAILAFIYSITAVVFPKFTMLAARNDMDGLKGSLVKVLKSIIYFLIPAAAGFIAMRYQLIDFLYGWGKVTANNISLASAIMALYALGITGVGIKEVVDRAFYSLKDTKKPAINGVIIMVVNIASSLVLIKFIGVLGIPLAYSISALTGAVVLLVLLRKKVGPFGGKKLVLGIIKVAVASIIMLAVIIPMNLMLQHHTFGHLVVDKGIKLFIPVITGGIVYYIATYCLKIDEAVDVLNQIKGRFAKA